MSRKQTDVFVCDRCGAIHPPRAPRYEGDDGFPNGWARVTFRDGTVNWENDLCVECGNDVGQVIRRKT